MKLAQAARKSGGGQEAENVSTAAVKSAPTEIKPPPRPAAAQPSEAKEAELLLRANKAAAVKAAAATGEQPAPSPGKAHPRDFAVPPDVAGFLDQASLSAYGPKLCGTLGLSCIQDFAFVSDSMLADIGMKPLECLRLRRAVVVCSMFLPTRDCMHETTFGNAPARALTPVDLHSFRRKPQRLREASRMPRCRRRPLSKILRAYPVGRAPSAAARVTKTLAELSSPPCVAQKM